jgi:hypothetical protein
MIPITLLDLTVKNLIKEIGHKAKNFAAATTTINGINYIFFASCNSIDQDIIDEFQGKYKAYNLKICPDLTEEQKKKEYLKVKKRKKDTGEIYEVSIEDLKAKLETCDAVEKKLVNRMITYLEQRWTCSERKILAVIDSLAEGQEIGEISLYTQLSVCHECDVLIDEFKKVYTKTNVVVYDYSQLIFSEK